jgi:hypothetical protein
MLGMRRFFLAFIAMFAGLVLVPAMAAAQELELGTTASKLVAPSCPKNVAPANCTIILTRTTALETLRDGVAYPSTVKTAGRIVAFTVGLSRLSSSASTTKQDIHYLDSTYGGTTRVAVTVLKPVGPKNKRRWQVVAESPPVHVQPWLGKVVRFPLAKSLPVTPGETVALTTPTWAPVLSINLSSKRFAYRQSRTSGCFPPTGNATQSVGQTTQYLCNYTGTRVEYSATDRGFELGHLVAVPESRHRDELPRGPGAHDRPRDDHRWRRLPDHGQARRKPRVVHAVVVAPGGNHADAEQRDQLAEPGVRIAAGSGRDRLEARGSEKPASLECRRDQSSVPADLVPRKLGRAGAELESGREAGGDDRAHHAHLGARVVPRHLEPVCVPAEPGQQVQQRAEH